MEKGEEDGNQEMVALPTFSNRQDQYTFRSPVTSGGWANLAVSNIRHISGHDPRFKEKSSL